MLRKWLITLAAAGLFFLGAYTEAGFHITPVVTAGCGTAKIMILDLYVNAVAPHLGKVNASSLIVSVAGFSALLLFKRLFGAGRI